MKDKYLKEIRMLLGQYEISRNEIDDIISDYSQMYDDGKDRGLSDTEIIDYLGKPEKVVDELGESYERRAKPERRRSNKIIALMPFLCTIAFFILGRYGYYHPGWVVFLLIPVSGIIFGMAGKNRRHLLIALSPFLTTGVFLTIGFVFHIWHPTWLVFLAIPVIAILSSWKTMRPLELLTALSPFVAVTAFIILGEFGYWNPGWLVFLIIPMIGILNMKNRTRAIWFEITFIVAIGIYLYCGYALGRWDYGALAFLLPIIYSIMINDFQFEFFKRDLPVKITAIIVIIVYFVGGILFNSWSYLWLVFLLIPVVAILAKGHRHNWFVAISPFIATTVFFVLGYFFDLWTIAWLAFLLIPIAGILKK
ncbi:MAG: DUF1700 domain-containing protein [Candidatus Izemoplasmatales bacterium]